MCGLFQGLCIAKDKGIKDIIILGDSLITISYLTNEGNSKDNYLSQILHRIRGLAKFFHSRDFYHILRINNVEIDLEANKACSMEEAKLESNDITSFCPIP